MIKKNISFTMAILFMFIFSFPAQARMKNRSGSYSTSKMKGGRGTRSVSRDQTGNVSRHSTWTNQNGKTGSHSVSRSWDKNSGTGTYNASTVMPGGRESSASGTITKTDTGFTTSGTRTNAKGETLDVNRTVTKNEDGTVSLNKVVMNSDGETRTVDKTITKTENGRSVTGSYSTSAGDSGTFAKEMVHDGATLTRTVTRTPKDEESKTHTQTVVLDSVATT